MASDREARKENPKLRVLTAPTIDRNRQVGARTLSLTTTKTKTSALGRVKVPQDNLQSIKDTSQNIQNAKNQQHEINSEKTTKYNHPEMTKMLERAKQVKVEVTVVFKNIKESKFKINKKTGNLAGWTETIERNQSARTKNYNGRNSLNGLKKILDMTKRTSLNSHRHYPTRGKEEKNTKNAHSLNYPDAT